MSERLMPYEEGGHAPNGVGDESLPVGMYGSSDTTPPVEPVDQQEERNGEVYGQPDPRIAAARAQQRE